MIKCKVILLLLVLSMSSAERRIRNGTDATETTFMVYLSKSSISPHPYDHWICGGVIVSPYFIVTSAACVQDVQYMYAVAGYRQYVNNTNLKNDPCTKAGRKKIVEICVPKTYELDYAKVEKWALIDIAIGRVETRYNFALKQPVPGCDYVPTKIQINYSERGQHPLTEAVVMGWGHPWSWREINDNKDLNLKHIQYSPMRIINKKRCRDKYNETANMTNIINKYMICVSAGGSFDDTGNLRDRNESFMNSKFLDGCTPEGESLRDGTEFCSEYDTRRRKLHNDTSNLRNVVSRKSASVSGNYGGICQNDHGGPLIGWMGGHRYLLGVASVFRVTKLFTCTGPYLFTSTHCTGEFLNCIISSDMTDKKWWTEGEKLKREEALKRCNLPAKERGYDLVRRTISWVDHPDGPAANELEDDLIERPQIPLSYIRGRN